MSNLSIIFTVMLSILSSTSVFAATQSPESRCLKSADTVIRKTIQNMGITADEVNFELETISVVNQSYDDAPIIRYSTNLIINSEGFFPGASAEVELVAREACEISRVNVNLNYTYPKQGPPNE